MPKDEQCVQQTDAIQDGKSKKRNTASLLSGGCVSYENVGFFSRTLNILCLISALFVIATGLLKILGENGINIDSRVKLAGVEFMFSGGVMLLLQGFVAIIWLLCFNKPARVGAVLFLMFLTTSFIFNSLLPAIVSHELSRLILSFCLSVGVFGSLMTVSFSEQYLKNTRGFALFFGILYVAAEALVVVLIKNLINLPSQVPIDLAVAVSKIFAMAAYIIMFLCLNTFWRKRKLKNKPLRISGI